MHIYRQFWIFQNVYFFISMYNDLIPYLILEKLKYQTFKFKMWVLYDCFSNVSTFSELFIFTVYMKFIILKFILIEVLYDNVFKIEFKQVYNKQY